MRRGPYMTDKLKIKEMKALLKKHKQTVKNYVNAHDYNGITVFANDINKSTADIYREIFAALGFGPAVSDDVNVSDSDSSSSSDVESDDEYDDDDDEKSKKSNMYQHRLSNEARQKILSLTE